MKSIWKQRRQAQSANRLFNQANEHWRRRQYFLLQGDEQAERESCAEVVRLCQLAIQADERMGDAYVLLANALLSAASRLSKMRQPEEYEFLQSRAAAVIHLWHSLPNRGYPITKNTEIGERLWKIVVEELRELKSLSEENTAALMDSYRDSLGTEAILPESFEEIKRAILQGATPPQGPLLEETLPPPMVAFLKQMLQGTEKTDWRKEVAIAGRIRLLPDISGYLKDVDLVSSVQLEITDRLKEATRNKEYLQAVGWLAWLFLLNLRERRTGLYEGSDEWRPLVRQSLDKVLIDLSKTLGAILAQARSLKDWDTVLLASEIFRWFDESAEEVQRVRNEIGDHDVLRRLEDMKRHPRMVIERLLAQRLLGYLGRP